MGSSQSSEVYDFRSFKICDGVSVGQISTMLSTSASDLRDCIKSAASVSDDAGDTIVSGCGGGVCTMKREQKKEKKQSRKKSYEEKHDSLFEIYFLLCVICSRIFNVQHVYHVVAEENSKV